MDRKVVLTADELEHVIAEAIRARDFDAVVAALRVLAVRDSRRAEAVLNTIELATFIGEHTSA